MEPLGAAASVITIAGVAFQFSISITKLIKELKEQKEDVAHLEENAVRLGAVIEQVQDAYTTKKGQVPLAHGGASSVNVLRLVHDATERCANDLERFETELTNTLSRRRGITGSLLRRWRLQVAAPIFSRLEKSIEGHQLSLNLLLQLLQGQSLENTRQLMAQGFAALLASNRQMYAMLQKSLSDQPGQSLTRHDTQATLVTPGGDEEELASATENDQMLHQFLEGIFAVWLKNMSADGDQPNSTPLTVPSPFGAQGSPLSRTSPMPSPSPNQESFDAYTLSKWRSRRQSSPGVGPKDAEVENALNPTMFSTSNQSTSNQSHASRISHDSAISMMTRSSSQSEKSQTSESSRLAARRERISRVRRGTNDSRSSKAPRVKIDLSNCEPEDREKGLKLLEHVQSNDVRNIEALIQDGATLEEEGKHEKTPLLLATYLGKVEAAHLLIQQGADLNATDKNDQTALHIAVRRPSAHAIIPTLIDTLKSPPLASIQENNPLINACDKDGRTPLHECARFGMLEPAKTLLDSGADINARDFAGLPPAYFAMSNRRVELTELLLSRDADFSSFQWPPSDKYGVSIERLLKNNNVQRPETPDEDGGDGGSARKVSSNRPTSRSFRLGRRRDSSKS